MKFGFWCSEKVNIRPFKVFSDGLYCFVFLLPFGVTGVKRYLKLCCFFFSYMVRSFIDNYLEVDFQKR